jgi:tRNA/tmRNA/rRNA uracil-C5-methylase (TrmA/RlmC/RlmD family)
MPHEEMILYIESMTYGAGARQVRGRRAAFVPGVIPGERARVRVEKVHRDYIETGLTEIVEPSPHRTAPSAGLSARAADATGSTLNTPSRCR